jgi:hypothetical protein
MFEHWQMATNTREAKVKHDSVSAQIKLNQRPFGLGTR